MQYFSFDSVLIGKKTKNTLWEKIIDWLLKPVGGIKKPPEN